MRVHRKTESAALCPLNLVRRQPGSTRNKFYQHPLVASRIAGSITTGATAISTSCRKPTWIFLQPPENQNTIYRIDNKTGILTRVKIQCLGIPWWTQCQRLVECILWSDTDAPSWVPWQGPDKEEIGAIYSVKASPTVRPPGILDKTDVGITSLQTWTTKGDYCRICPQIRNLVSSIDASNHVTGAPWLEILPKVWDRGRW